MLTPEMPWRDSRSIAASRMRVCLSICSPEFTALVPIWPDYCLRDRERTFTPEPKGICNCSRSQIIQTMNGGAVVVVLNKFDILRQVGDTCRALKTALSPGQRPARRRCTP